MKAVHLSVALLGLLSSIVPLAQAQEPLLPPIAAAPTVFDATKPETTVQSFLTAFSRGDAQEIAKYVDGAIATPELNTVLGTMRRASLPSDFRILLTPIKTTLTAPNEAVVTFTIQSSSSINLFTSSFSAVAPDAVLLKHNTDGWQIVAPTPDDILVNKEEKPLDDNVVRYFAFMMRYPDKAPQVQIMLAGNSAVKDVKKITNGLMMLAHDSNQVLQVNPTQYRTSLTYYVAGDDTYRPPLDKVGTVSYRFNRRLVSKSLADFVTPSKTVLIYEGEEGKPAFRYNGLAVIGYADGSAKLVTPEEAKKLRWTP